MHDPASLFPLKVPLVVELDGHLLLADMSTYGYRAATPRVFDSFCELAGGDDVDVLKFARIWGTFGLCAEHKWPGEHPASRNNPDSAAEYCPLRIAKKSGRAYYAEPIGRWHVLSSSAAALRRIGVDVLAGGRGTRADWRVALNGSPCARMHQGDQEPWTSRQRAVKELSERVQEWLDFGRIRPNFRWDAGRQRWTLNHGPGSGEWKLFGWLALRLAIETAGGKSVTCPFCQKVYFPRRLPTPGKGHCCSSEVCKRAYFTEYKRKQRGTLR